MNPRERERLSERGGVSPPVPEAREDFRAGDVSPPVLRLLRHVMVKL